MDRAQIGRHPTGSGNVFADLGLPDAEERLAKANLAHVIINIVEDRGWAQKKAASVLGVAESEMSDIMNGKLRAGVLVQVLAAIVADTRDLNR